MLTAMTLIRLGSSESSLGAYVILRLVLSSNIIVNTILARNMSSNFVIWMCRYPIIDLSAWNEMIQKMYESLDGIYRLAINGLILLVNND